MNTAARMLTTILFALLVAACAAPDEDAAATAPENAGFLSDYSLLSNPEWDGAIKGYYIDPQLAQSIEKYSGVMIDQPEVFVSVDSPYRGVKPDGLKMVADLMRYLLVGEMLRGGYNVVESPGDDVAFLRVAITDLQVEKVAGTAAYVPMAQSQTDQPELVRAFMATLNIVDVNIEIELVDSMTNQVIIAGVAHDELLDSEQGAAAKWAGLGELLEQLAAGMSCLVNKANLPADARIDICRGSTALPAL